MKYNWQKNISTGNYLATINESVQLIRIHGGGFYYARERGGDSWAAIRQGRLETTPKKAIASLEKILAS